MWQQYIYTTCINLQTYHHRFANIIPFFISMTSSNSIIFVERALELLIRRFMNTGRHDRTLELRGKLRTTSMKGCSCIIVSQTTLDGDVGPVLCEDLLLYGGLSEFFGHVWLKDDSWQVDIIWGDWTLTMSIVISSNYLNLIILST